MKNDHCLPTQPLAQRAYQTFAPHAVLTRLLAHHAEIGLSNSQIRQLLDVKRKYRKFLLVHWPKLINNWSELDWETNERAPNRERCLELVRARADLTRELDEFFLETSFEIDAILTDEQHETVIELYEIEKTEYFSLIAAPLKHKFECVAGLFRN